MSLHGNVRGVLLGECCLHTAMGFLSHTCNTSHSKFQKLNIWLQSGFGAQRALLKNGLIISGKLMVGVKPLENLHRGAAESMNKAPHMQITAPVRPVIIRPYKLEGSQSQV